MSFITLATFCSHKFNCRPEEDHGAQLKAPDSIRLEEMTATQKGFGIAPSALGEWHRWYPILGQTSSFLRGIRRWSREGGGYTCINLIALLLLAFSLVSKFSAFSIIIIILFSTLGGTFSFDLRPVHELLLMHQHPVQGPFVCSSSSSL